MSDAALEIVPRRDRAILVAALVLLTLVAWAYLWGLADDMAMGGMDMTGFRMVPAGIGMMMPATAPWRPVEFVFVFAMWIVMTIGMITPTAAPMTLLYARVGRRTANQNRPFPAAMWFLGGYLLAWTVFSFAATLTQWGLDRATLLTPMMESASRILGGCVLIAAGLHQWTPLKGGFLRQWQALLMFIQRRDGIASGSVA